MRISTLQEGILFMCMPLGTDTEEQIHMINDELYILVHLIAFGGLGQIIHGIGGILTILCGGDQ